LQQQVSVLTSREPATLSASVLLLAHNASSRIFGWMIRVVAATFAARSANLSWVESSFQLG